MKMLAVCLLLVAVGCSADKGHGHHHVAAPSYGGYNNYGASYSNHAPPDVFFNGKGVPNKPLHSAAHEYFSKAYAIEPYQYKGHAPTYTSHVPVTPNLNYDNKGFGAAFTNKGFTIPQPVAYAPPARSHEPSYAPAIPLYDSYAPSYNSYEPASPYGQTSLGGYNAPSSSYGLPKQKKLKAPKHGYGAPKAHKFSFNFHKSPKSSYGAPKHKKAPKSSYGAPKAPKASYGAPTLNSHPHAPKYGAPIHSQSGFTYPSAFHSSPASSHGVPSYGPAYSVQAPVYNTPAIQPAPAYTSPYSSSGSSSSFATSYNVPTPIASSHSSTTSFIPQYASQSSLAQTQNLISPDVSSYTSSEFHQLPVAPQTATSHVYPASLPISSAGQYGTQAAQHPAGQSYNLPTASKNPAANLFQSPLSASSYGSPTAAYNTPTIQAQIPYAPKPYAPSSSAYSEVAAKPLPQDGYTYSRPATSYAAADNLAQAAPSVLSYRAPSLTYNTPSIQAQILSAPQPDDLSYSVPVSSALAPSAARPTSYNGHVPKPHNLQAPQGLSTAASSAYSVPAATSYSGTNVPTINTPHVQDSSASGFPAYSPPEKPVTGNQATLAHPNNGAPQQTAQPLSTGYFSIVQASGIAGLSAHSPPAAVSYPLINAPTHNSPYAPDSSAPGFPAYNAPGKQALESQAIPAYPDYSASQQIAQPLSTEYFSAAHTSGISTPALSDEKSVLELADPYGNTLVQRQPAPIQSIYSSGKALPYSVAPASTISAHGASSLPSYSGEASRTSSVIQQQTLANGQLASQSIIDPSSNSISSSRQPKFAFGQAQTASATLLVQDYNQQINEINPYTAAQPFSQAFIEPSPEIITAPSVHDYANQKTQDTSAWIPMAGPEPQLVEDEIPFSADPIPGVSNAIQEESSTLSSISNEIVGQDSTSLIDIVDLRTEPVTSSSV
ncbi:uncharacterized protein LOC136033732 [Artemia franciscana]|uniref:uncharacterized protein LOC136033732 n=1 Tax=Artemia franciscana TaxID=6661 RepID=UPI0032DAB748